MKKWAWEQDATNTISITRDGIEMCQIISTSPDDEVTEWEKRTAQFIVTACNGMEITSPFET